MKLRPKIVMLLTAFSGFFLSGNFNLFSNDTGYSFKDEEGKEVVLPNRPQISFKSPGILAHLADRHNPVVQIKSRQEGLEDIRTLRLEFRESAGQDETDPITKVYLTDKDGLVIGYQDLLKSTSKLKFVINGVINYVQIWVECEKHGLWTKRLVLDIQS